MLLKNAQRSGLMSDTVFRCLVSLHAMTQRSRVTLDSRINGSHCNGFRRILNSLEVIDAVYAVRCEVHMSWVGDPANVQLSGLSAGACREKTRTCEIDSSQCQGAYSVHQILHHISHLPEGQKSPIKSAILQSNAILYVSRTKI